MSTTFYPVILFAQSPAGSHMELVYSEDEMTGFYSQFNIPGYRIISIPAIQKWFSEKIEAHNLLVLKILQSEGFHIVDPAFYKDEDDYIVEKRVVIRKALEVFGNEERAERWLNRKNGALENKKPADLYGSLRGLVQVNNLLLAKVKNPVSSSFLTRFKTLS